jgi:iron complex outermembrane recepter protein
MNNFKCLQRFKKKLYTSRALLVVFFLLIGIGSVKAQLMVSGKIIDSTSNSGLPNVTVREKGTANAVVSGKEGFFNITVKNNESVLTFSFVGKKTVERMIGKSDLINIALFDDEMFLMPEVVVTGTFNPSLRLNSSISLTTLNQQQLDLRVPLRGIGDLMRTVPGFQMTTQQGEVGNNINIRGLPQGSGSFKYVSLREDGLPVFEIPDGFGIFVDGMAKIDETLRKVEVLRGGTAAIFSSNNPGAIMNLLSKTGDSLQQYGTAKITYGTQQLYRIDMNTGGPLGKNWQYNIGGFYRYDVGVKPTGSSSFPNNNGGQIKLNITRTFNDNNGYVRFYAKYMNDKNLWFTGVPIKNISGKSEAIETGPDVSAGTLFSTNARYITLRNPWVAGNPKMTKDLADGVSNKYTSIGVEINRDFGRGWNFTLRSRYINDKNTTNAVVDNTSPYPDSLPLGFNTQLRGSTGFNTQPGFVPPIKVVLRNATTGQQFFTKDSINGNGLMNAVIGVFGERPVTNFVSEAQLTKKIKSHALTMGLYASNYTIDTRLTQTLIYQAVSVHPTILGIDTLGSITFPPIPAFNGIRAALPIIRPLLSSQGVIEGVGSTYANGRDRATILALFAGDSWHPTEELNIEYGVRYDLSYYNGSTERPTNTSFNQVGSGTYRTWKYDYNNWGGSLGINYKVTNRTALYGRVSRGTRTPTSTQWINTVDNNNQATGNTLDGTTEKIFQAEVGVKSMTEKLSFYSNIFLSTANNVNNLLTLNNGTGVYIKQVISATRAYGLEMELIYFPVQNLQLRGMATLQDPRWTSFNYTNLLARPTLGDTSYTRDYDNNIIRGMARAIVDVSASYSTGKGLGAFVNARYRSSLPINDGNVYFIKPGMETFAGINYSFSKIEVAVQAANLFNIKNIQEVGVRLREDLIGVDAQTGGFQTVSPSTGRIERTSKYINGNGPLPRSILFSVAYKF